MVLVSASHYMAFSVTWPVSNVWVFLMLLNLLARFQNSVS